MEYLNLLLFVSIAVPLGLMSIICKDRTRSLLVFFICGLGVGLFCGELNAIIQKLLPYSYRFFVTNITPVVEEVFKALPILFYAFEFRPKRQELLENSIAVGVGFAVLENAYVFASNIGSISVVTAIMRGFGAGLMHAITTLMIGFGMSFVHIRRKIFYSGTTALLAAAVIYHSLYNNLVCTNHILEGFLITTLVVAVGYYGLKKNKFL